MHVQNCCHIHIVSKTFIPNLCHLPALFNCWQLLHKSCAKTWWTLRDVRSFYNILRNGYCVLEHCNDNFQFVFVLFRFVYFVVVVVLFVCFHIVNTTDTVARYCCCSSGMYEQVINHAHSMLTIVAGIFATAANLYWTQTTTISYNLCTTSRTVLPETKLIYLIVYLPQVSTYAYSFYHV